MLASKYNVPMPAFSYNVTREYPYKWFTPVAIVGGVFLTMLFSFINFFSNAYIMVSVTTNDPSNVEHSGGLLDRFLASRFQPSCEDVVIPVGSYFYTNQTGLSYQLSAVSEQSHSPSTSLPALAYHNAPLTCQFNPVTVIFQTWYDRSPRGILTSAWGAEATCSIACFFNSSSNVEVKIDLQTRYDASAAIPGVSAFMRADPKSLASLYWSQQLLLAFWEETVTTMADQTRIHKSESSGPRYNLSYGFVNLIASNEDIKDQRFFGPASWVFSAPDDGQPYVNQSDISYNSVIKNGKWPDVWSPVDRLGKALLSAARIDLGQPEALYAESSMIADLDSLRFWTKNFSTIKNQSAGRVRGIGEDLYDYDTAQHNPKTATGELRFSPSVISATYLCQKPHLRSPTNIFVSILVADLVLLRAAWSIYNLVVGYFLKSRHPGTNTCDGCLARKKEDETMIKTPTINSNITAEGSSRQSIELNQFASPRSSIGQQESTCDPLTHQHDEAQLLLETSQTMHHLAPGYPTSSPAYSRSTSNRTTTR